MEIPEVHVLNRIDWQFFGTLTFKSERLPERVRIGFSSRYAESWVFDRFRIGLFLLVASVFLLPHKVMFDKNQPAYKRLREIYAEDTKQIVAWTGAGLSLDAGLPTWNGLRKTLLESAERIALHLQEVPRRVAFNEAEFAPYRGAGCGAVAGQLVVTADDGAVHISDGTHVTLLPVTSYTKEMVDREIGNGENLASSDPRMRQYVRSNRTDGGGNFIFDHVRPGEYFVCGLAEWYFGDDAQYQWACDRVTVGHGQTVRIKLSKNLHRPGSPTLVIWALE